VCYAKNSTQTDFPPVGRIFVVEGLGATIMAVIPVAARQLLAVWWLWWSRWVGEGVLRRSGEGVVQWS